ncbi:hypothetical protein [Streptomyces sp. NPDC088557]|uniref:hypothetical protein n=1 Tax=Streptomyces sp. NPDC088557 TaxID=3365867 RepID=UPI0038218164
MAAQAPRTLLTEDQFARAVEAAESVVLPSVMGADAIGSVVTAALFEVGFISPPPPADPDTCTALVPDDRGFWVQCLEDPGHDDRHETGEWSWTDDHDGAVPASTG